MTKHFKSSLILSLILSLTIGLLPSSASTGKGKISAEALRVSGNPFSKPPAAKLRSKILRGLAGRQDSAMLQGQSVTLLPDGRLLVVGGETADGPAGEAIIKDQAGDSAIAVASRLHSPRSGHSATMLPDGTVLIFGGRGADGKLVDTAERFDPETQKFEILPSVKLTPRVYHTATTLTDGRVLIAGGLDKKGRVLGKAELWDPQTGGSLIVPDRLITARYGHTATLKADGSVLLRGGRGKEGETLNNPESFKPQERQFGSAEASPIQESLSALKLEASLPEDGAANTPADTRIALRFSAPLRVETANADAITLHGPQGPVATNIAPAEEGMLVFITPKKPLLAGTTYNLSLNRLSDRSNSPLPSTVITFTTTGGRLPEFQPSYTEEWIPEGAALQGDWRTRRGDSPWQSLPPLQAESGVTALAGQVLTLDGNPLANVTLRIEDKSARTDSTGRFLLTSVGAGRREMLIDGRTVNKRKKTYGVFETGVEVKPSETNALSYTIWMPKIDTAHEVTIPSPTTSEVVVTTPYIPGLELHIPPDTVIRDDEGKPVTRLSITPIPVDRPPFPLPQGVYVPIYFTVQPGGAYVKNLNPSGPKGARLIYPNYRHETPGARANFWHYDPEDRGWYVYGQGTVTADGRQVVPDPGVSIYKFTGAMINVSGYVPQADGPPPGGAAYGADPVDLSSGLFVLQNTDLVVSDIMPLAVTRTYRQNDNVSRQFGIGATLAVDMYLWSAAQYSETDLILPDGGRIHYVRTSPGTGFIDAVFEHTTTPTKFYKSVITFNGHGWDLKLRDGTVYVFGDNAPLQSIRDRYGNQINVTRTGLNFVGNQVGNITKLSSPNGRYIEFTNDANNRVTEIKDNIGRTVAYAYDVDGNLWKVTSPDNKTNEYTYDASHRLLTIKDARGIVYLTNEYDADGRVAKQTQADLTTFEFDYTVVNNKVTQTDLTDPRGNVRRVTFNSDGHMLTDTYAFGKPEQQTYTYQLQAGTNLTQSVTDELGRQKAWTYDSFGNVTSVTTLAGTAQAVTTSFTYEPTFKQLATTTDPLNHTVTFGYDSNGNLTSVTDPLNNQSTFAYNAAGQLISATDPVNKTSYFTYDGGDLVSTTLPAGQTVKIFTDAAGRTVSVTSPTGPASRTDYDSLNRVIKRTDPLSGLTQFAYDPNGNLLTVTDARNNSLSYTYDNMDRTQSRTDAMLKQTTYLYDNNGNLRQVTDRKGQVTSYTYDALNRMVLATYADTSTIGYTYDKGNRLTQISDSISGVITYTYDDMDRLLSETTPRGTVSYTYDAAGRLSTKTIPGQATINYTYDGANRLTQILQGAASVTFSYDAASRLASRTTPLGVVAEYGYDDGSRLTSITYKKGAVTLGDLTYEYDLAGHRTKMGGSLARTSLPQALSATSYNNVNRQSVVVTYDFNGNLTNDGANSYVWNARDQLMSVTGPGVNATFQYDAIGRRSSKTVVGTTTSYLYDDLTIVQEQVGATPSADLLTGGLDMFFSRTDATGTNTPLVDALGSTIALVDSSGAIQTRYSYEPFGKTTASGAASGNTQKYTGREDDGTGLYYNRGRYYSPTLQRFISEDPIGIAGGINQYAYVGNNPISLIDPLGLSPWWDPFDWFAGPTACEWLGKIGTLSAGFGDHVSLGLTDKVRDLNGANSAVAKKSGWYTTGTGLGYAWDMAMIGGSLKSLARAGGTVWDLMKSAGSLWEGTNIPRTFEVTLDGYKFFVNTSGTKHMAELALRYSLTNTNSVRMASQAILEDFVAAAQAAVRQGIKPGVLVQAGRWGFVFGESSIPGGLPVIYHALFR